MRVERSWDDREGVIEPKSQSSRRQVPIVRPYLSAVLEELRERTGRSGTELVFGPTADVPFEPAQVLRRVAKTLEDANEEREEAEQEPLRRFGLHDGRHTFGAMCRAAGNRRRKASASQDRGALRRPRRAHAALLVRPPTSTPDESLASRGRPHRARLGAA
jgi:integrase